MKTPANPRRRARLGLIGLAAMFLLPLAAAFLLYYGSGWRPAGSTQHGRLIDPARPLPNVTLATADGGSTGPDFLRNSWHLVYIGEGDCDPGCRATLVKTRQVRLALEKDLNRVHRVFLYAGAPAADYLATEHHDLVAADITGEAGKRLLAPFPQDPPPLTARRLYLVDPLGNLMMSYPPDAPPKAILTDLKRLLRLSHIG